MNDILEIFLRLVLLGFLILWTIESWIYILN